MPVAKTRASGTMTEASFWAFIRSGLRNKSRRWKPIYDCLNAAKRKSTSKTNKRLKYQYVCAHCKKRFAKTDVSVDHIKPVGSLRSYSDLPRFVEFLFCELDNLQVLCSQCHLAKGKKDKECAS